MSPFWINASRSYLAGVSLGTVAVLGAALLFHCSSQARTPLLYLLPAGGLFLGGIVLIVLSTVFFFAARD